MSSNGVKKLGGGSWLGSTFGQLEDRSVPSVVSVSFDGAGQLRVTGDADANNVSVYIGGASASVAAGAGTVIQGPSSIQGVVRGVYAALGAGDDTFRLQTNGVTSLVNTDIRGGDGYDNVSAYINTSGNVTVNLGRSDDQFYFSGTAANLNVDGSVGNNRIDIRLGAGSFNSVTVDSDERASSGRDTVNITGSGQATRVNNILIQTGAQNDTVSVSYLTIGQRLYSHGGTGELDTITLSGIWLERGNAIEFQGYERLN
ncbi:unnamed protein product [Gemmata massiliana]|uniref:Autotransporter outer membrane beta-barrel domain-containing protein n=1 Tax=Gemmata massiliana TaxID=1210884 RepID=A0A6P2CZE1_9BACT|nr:hypothetical protein [Gemmata massiliana]VTR93164.1 unnamed protein product [Gemmata massiliana]